MTEYKRFTIQVLGTADSVDALTLHSAIESALNGIAKCRVKSVNLDMWVDGFTGDPRSFDENGKEIVKAVEETPIEEIPVEEVFSTIDESTTVEEPAIQIEDVK